MHTARDDSIKHGIVIVCFFVFTTMLNAMLNTMLNMMLNTYHIRDIHIIYILVGGNAPENAAKHGATLDKNRKDMTMKAKSWDDESWGPEFIIYSI